MQPSRGIRRLAQCRPTRQVQCQYRSLSFLPRHTKRGVLQTSRPHDLSRHTFAVSLPSIAAIRHASTDTAQSTSAPTPSSPGNASFPNLDTITLDNIDLKDPLTDISAIPEGIGYLKQIGIDHGIGPTSAIQWFLEHAHVWGGLPWWASIVATAFTVRIALFPMFLRSSDMLARQNALTSVTKPITDRMTKAQKEGNTQEVMMYWQQLSAIRKRAGISMPQQLIPLALQGIIGYCGFKLMRKCAELPVPGFVDGGFLWLRDLTMTDGYLLMPILMAGTIHMVVRLGGETGAASATMPPGMKKFMLWGMPSIIAFITVWQPGAVCVWFASTGLMGIAQGQALQRPKVREFFGLAPLYQPKPNEGSGSFIEAVMKDKIGELYPNTTQPTKTPLSSSSGVTAGKNAAFMQPTYQSPNLNRQASGRTIDTTLVTPQPPATPAPASEMVQPKTKPSSKQGILGGFTTGLNNIKRAVKKRTTKTAAQQREAEKEAFKRRAANYEKTARERGR